MKSYVFGANSQPLIGETIGELFDRVCDAQPDALAVVARHQELRLTFRELRQRVDAVATALLSFGLVPGDRVALWSPNCVEWVIVQFATAKAGLIQVNINPAYRREELRYVLKKVQCSALIAAARFKTSEYLDMVRDLAPELSSSPKGKLDSKEFPDLRLVVTIGDESEGGVPFRELEQHNCDQERLQQIASGLDFDDPINIQFTSGTTGFPKGATLSHHNIINNAYFTGQGIGLTRGDRLCIPVPLYHCFGMVMGSLACITHSAAMVFPAAIFDPAETLSAVSNEACTHLYGVPTMFIAMLSLPEFSNAELSSLRGGIMAGSPCPIEVMRKVMSDMHMPEVTIAYGMTETSPVSFQSDRLDEAERRAMTVGRIHPHLEVKIVDENDRIVPRGSPGEICVRGYSVMKGYWADEDRTAEVLTADGWMRTGDLASIDDDGFCNIVGRKKDMVIRGGENLYPREIEEFLYQHPSIRDVYVIGVPDEKYGEELCAWIALKQNESVTEDQIRAFCKGSIMHHKIPRYIRFVEEFPMTVTGKVQKFEMRNIMITELGLSEAITA
ncbi:AMP-binding protein [Hyphococcus sp.]|uniref:AMP-binding protein n=1 Tax=Hyphococcus sp. TaxID=2038636 RepID=UPI003CCB7C23